ncbi:hypothetical protein [Klebsiella pneumoniae]|uniref:hypothetical protein n=1 Tax=Klebsiella pneumoniae TaxID=573 RepID=UPI001885B844|nr:hypothetical protein [Klebsiella pneumoniae]
MLEQLDQKGIRVNGARRLYVALNNGVKAEVLGNCGPATISLVDGMIVVEEQTLH